MPSSSPHDHSHGSDPGSPPSAEVRDRRRRAVSLMLLVLLPVGLATAVGLVALWPSGGPSRAQQVAETYLPPGTTYPGARVVEVQPVADCPTAGTCATAVVEVTDGPGAGEFVQIQLPPEVVGAGLERDDGLVLTRDAGAEGGASYAFYDFERDVPIVTLAAAFALVIGLVARLRGLAALVGLAFAFLVLLRFVLPGILAQESPLLVTLVGSAAIMFVVLYLAHGFSARTTTALLGTIFGLFLVAALGSASVSAARLTGLIGDETIFLATYDPTLDFSGLVIAGVVVAGLGVLNDVTITQASAVWQLHEASPDMGWRDLYRRGMAIGRDHIASTVYTIVFAYAGASLPLLLIFELSDRPAWVTITSSVLSEEVIRTMVGSIALVLAVPVTTAVGAFFALAADSSTGPAGGAEPGPRLAALRARFAR